MKRAGQLITAFTNYKISHVVEDKTTIQRHKRLETPHLGRAEQNSINVKCLTTSLRTATESSDDIGNRQTGVMLQDVQITGQTSDNHFISYVDLDHTASNIKPFSSSLGKKRDFPKRR